MERYLGVNLLGPGLRLVKRSLPGRGLTKVEKHCLRRCGYCDRHICMLLMAITDLTPKVILQSSKFNLRIDINNLSSLQLQKLFRT